MQKILNVNRLWNLNSPPRNPPYIKIKSPTAAAACLHRRVNSTEASPPAASALYLPVLGLVTTDFVSHQTPAAVSNTEHW